MSVKAPKASDKQSNSTEKTEGKTFGDYFKEGFRETFITFAYFVNPSFKETVRSIFATIYHNDNGEKNGKKGDGKDRTNDDDSQTDDQSDDQSDDQDGSQDDGQPSSRRTTKSDLEIVIPKGGVYEVDSHYEMTVYINDVNREHTEVLGSYGGKESEDKNYVYGVQRLTSDGPQDKNNLTYLYDGRGSVVQTYKEDLDIKSYSYDPNGEYLNSEPNDSIFGYNGEEYNPNIDAQYLRARYLDVSMGRFLSQDTYRGDTKQPLSLNLYAYANNDPVTYKDPSGHIALDGEGNTAIAYGLAYNPSPASSSVANQKTLKDVQSKLNSLGYVGSNGKPLTVDGINGSNTQYAVKAFQAKAGLTADGVAGTKTKAALFGSYPPRNVDKTPPPPPAPAPVSPPQTSSTIKSHAEVAAEQAKENNKKNKQDCGIAKNAPIIAGSTIAVGSPGIKLPSLPSIGDILAGLGSVSLLGLEILLLPLTLTGDTPQEKDGTVIYRGGSDTYYNLTPRERDIGGLSYFLVPPSEGSFTITTIEFVNATGVLRAKRDGVEAGGPHKQYHVSVFPVNMATMPEWIASKGNANENPHEYSRILKSISTRGKV